MKPFLFLKREAQASQSASAPRLLTDDETAMVAGGDTGTLYDCGDETHWCHGIHTDD